MKETQDNEELLTRYLLGEMSDEEQERVERRYIDDREFYEQLLIVEDDLIDAYARGEMTEHQRQIFERRFLISPERRKRVEFAQSLETFIAEKKQPIRNTSEPPEKPVRAGFFSIFSWPAAARYAVGAVLIALCAWLAFEVVSLRNRIERVESEKASLEQQQRELDRQASDKRKGNEDLSAQPDGERVKPVEESPLDVTPGQQKAKVASLALSPGLVRGEGGANRLVIPPGAEQVEITVGFRKSDFKSYRAAIQTVDGREVFSLAGLKAKATGESKSVKLRVPSRVFSTDDYILILTGIADDGAPEPVGDYSFPVIKK